VVSTESSTSPEVASVGMTFTPSKRVKLMFALLGFFSAVPVVVFGLLLQSHLGAVIVAAGLAFGVLSASRARLIRLIVDNAGIQIVWRTITVDLDDFVAFEQVAAWWGLFTGSSPILGIRVRDGIYSISSLATFGIPPNAPEVQAMLEQIKSFQGGPRAI
jgi:hypothetical protein